MRRGAARAVVVAFLFLPLLPTRAVASVSCTHSAGEVRLALTDPDHTVVVGTTPDGEIYVDFDRCRGSGGGNATVNNTDLIRIQDTSEDHAASVYFDLENGGFSPGKTAEASGESEIEIVQ